MEEQQDGNIWEEFGVTEQQWDAIAAQLAHAEEDAGDLVEYCKSAFPTSAEAQIKAFIIATDYYDWQTDEGDDDETDEGDDDETDEGDDDETDAADESGAADEDSTKEQTPTSGAPF